MKWILRGATYRIDCNILLMGEGIIDKVVKINVRRDSDNYWWGGAAYAAGKTDITLTQRDATNEPGFYYYDLPALGSADAGTLTIRYFCVDAACTFDAVETVEIKPDFYKKINLIPACI